MNIRNLFVTLVTAACAAVASPRWVESQAISAAEIAQLRANPELIREKIRTSGLSADQVRERLAAAGYSSNLLDAFLVDSSASPGSVLSVADEVVSALSVLSVTDRSAEGLRAVSPDVGLTRTTRLASDEELQLFGADVFRGRTTQFQPLLQGPVSESYRVGPGDVLVLVVTGDVELVHTLEVTRDGFVMIPQVGQVYLNNLTMEQLRLTFRRRLAASYSGIARGTTQMDVTLARLRTNQVFVIGEVAQPGAYQLSSVATVLNALYAAGGPTDRGNFRRVILRRGDSVVTSFDLYDYLLRGDNANDVVLEQGDVLFVPTHGPRVEVRGAVVRPAIYELKEGDQLSDIVAAAGGYRANASLRRIAVSRVLPARAPGASAPDRIVLDVSLQSAGAVPPFTLQAGDKITVLEVPDAVRATVEVAGAVYLPGTFAWKDGLRLSELISLAGGFTTGFYSGRALIERLDADDSTRFVVQVELPPGADSAWVTDPAIEEYDRVTVFSRERFREQRTIGVSGMVVSPGRFEYRAGMTLRDALLLAQGLRDGARLDSVEVATLPSDRSGGRLAVVRRVGIDSSYVFEPEGSTYQRLPGEAGPPRGSAPEVLLEPFDEILVLRQPEFELQRTVKLVGEVATPGTFALQRKSERVSELLRRAGGALSTAYLPGARLIRQHEGAGLLDVDLSRALAAPGSIDDVVLLPGDSLYVPEYVPSVRVEGSVESPVSVLYRKGAPLSYYVSSAGGWKRTADRSRVSVRFANGRTETTDRVLLLFRNQPDVLPGATIFVPDKGPRKEFDTTAFLASLAQVVASTVAILAITNRF